MIDLHSHTFFSDGVLSPNELVQRARQFGYKALAITDHVDASNVDFVVKEIVNFCNSIRSYYDDIIVLPGVEITHVHPDQINEVAELAKKRGAKIVVVHGETIVEPVERLTNRKALESKFVDILGHPGLISEEEVKIAVSNGKYIEITARKGHSLTNGYVAKVCKKFGAMMVIDTDTHTPDNLITKDFAYKILKGAGLEDEDIARVFKNSEDLVKSVV
ncbi:MAG: histidinol phosphate phosphatase domain-containing protein [Spirochaetia bacterium]|nr:histidinol phosphate phosphatase domain-containing protein [Spirochaetota bacterium]MCX8096172.1 histidinol phosphate phosphatase domain-containing protein [Spirochaetota bacterium]MDW8113014.1 histidinol phosphate phosphatase domain-containing protein [Spirochaetia bacterium]